MKIHRLTRESYESLEKELKYLKTDREKEVAELIKEARSFGDLSENSEYDEAKNEQGKLYSRIAEIEAILLNSEIFEGAEQSGKAQIGTRVTVTDKSGERREYTIVSTREANPRERKISDESPLGHALVGRAVGETAEYETPAGRHELTIEDIAVA